MLQAVDQCHNCAGLGWFIGPPGMETQKCNACNGTGKRPPAYCQIAVDGYRCILKDGHKEDHCFPGMPDKSAINHPSPDQDEAAFAETFRLVSHGDYYLGKAVEHVWNSHGKDVNFLRRAIRYLERKIKSLEGKSV